MSIVLYNKTLFFAILADIRSCLGSFMLVTKSMIVSLLASVRMLFYLMQ